ncbi:MAG: transposase, partial [Candidatus Diapherotrites archaeon]|nr:transposase [Candidatus Diapherotrites archaeon]
MQYTKTVKVPCHWDTTEQKINHLDNITARLTYAVQLWSDLIKKNDIKFRKQMQNLEFQHNIQEITKLSAGFVQQAGHKALWMWKQYRTTHRKWEWKVSKAQKETKYYEKLLKREPSEPFSNNRTLVHKVPIRLDSRTGHVRNVDLKLTKWMVEISTLKKNNRMALLLNPSKYHARLLESGEIRDFEIIKKVKKYYVHIVCQFETEDVKPTKLLSIDLGIKRTLTTVLFSHGKEPKLTFVSDEDKQAKLQFYNELFGKLKQKKCWNKLKQLRHKRKNIAEYYDWLTAKELSENVEKDSIVVIGKVTHIREKQYKGNENKKHRTRINQWAYLRISNNVIHKLAQKGVTTHAIFESWTSKTCNYCGS